MTVPASCWCPQRSCWEKPGCSFQKQQALHCRWLWLLLVQLCVVQQSNLYVSIQQSNLGWTGHSPHGILLNCSLLIVGRTESGSLAAVPAVRLRLLRISCWQILSCILRMLDGPSLSGRGECTVPGAALPSPSTGGDGWTERCICTLHWPRPAARLLLHAGQELHCQHVSMGKAFTSCSCLVFPFS